jgi:hypothetical protein
MSVERAVEWLARETDVLGEYQPQFRFVHHKSHMIWPGLEPGQPRWESKPLTAWATAWPISDLALFLCLVLTCPGRCPVRVSAVTPAFLLESSILWDVLPCSLRSVCHLISLWFLAGLVPRPWSWRRYVSPKRLLTVSELHCVIYQKIDLFIATAVRNSNSTFWLKLLYVSQENTGTRI